jgi:uracil-DNA glycosylase
MIKGWEHLKFWKHTWLDLEGELQNYDNWGSKIFPDKKNWFRALELTPFRSVRCVILGQDPYPAKGYANGLAFSVYPHVRPLPRSLRNVFGEYQSDLGYDMPRNGDLTAWAERGVLLLNTILTVEEGKPLSHAGIGWEKLTFEIVKALDKQEHPPVFVLWGRRVQEYKAAVSNDRVILSPHPSPLSANQGFFGSRPFSRVNELLKGQGLKEVNWQLS